MPQAGFEPGIPMFEWPKTVLALDHVAIETGHLMNHLYFHTSVYISVNYQFGFGTHAWFSWLQKVNLHFISCN